MNRIHGKSDFLYVDIKRGTCVQLQQDICFIEYRIWLDFKLQMNKLACFPIILGGKSFFPRQYVWNIRDNMTMFGIRFLEYRTIIYGYEFQDFFVITDKQPHGNYARIIIYSYCHTDFVFLVPFFLAACQQSDFGCLNCRC